MMLARSAASASSKRLLSFPTATRAAALLPSLATAANAPRMLQQRSILPLAALAASATSSSRRALASMPHPSYQFSTSKFTTIIPAAPPFLSCLVPPLILPFLSPRNKTVYEDVWPMASTNTILNVCPQGERFVVERFGKLLDIKESGWFLGTCVYCGKALSLLIEFACVSLGFFHATRFHVASDF